MSGLNDVSDAFAGWEISLAGARVSGSYVNGRWVAGTPTVLSFTGVVQIATPDDLKVLEEGQRNEEAIKIHTNFNLICQIGDTTTGDTIDYEGHSWLVYNVAHRTIGGYHKAIAIKRD